MDCILGNADRLGMSTSSQLQHIEIQSFIMIMIMMNMTMMMVIVYVFGVELFCVISIMERIIGKMYHNQHIWYVNENRMNMLCYFPLQLLP